MSQVGGLDFSPIAAFFVLNLLSSSVASLGAGYPQPNGAAPERRRARLQMSRMPQLGGGMYNEESSPTLANCTICGNDVAGTLSEANQIEGEWTTGFRCNCVEADCSSCGSL